MKLLSFSLLALGVSSRHQHHLVTNSPIYHLNDAGQMFQGWTSPSAANKVSWEPLNGKWIAISCRYTYRYPLCFAIDRNGEVFEGDVSYNEIQNNGGQVNWKKKPTVDSTTQESFFARYISYSKGGAVDVVDLDGKLWWSKSGDDDFGWHPQLKEDPRWADDDPNAPYVPVPTHQEVKGPSQIGNLVDVAVLGRSIFGVNREGDLVLHQIKGYYSDISGYIPNVGATQEIVQVAKNNNLKRVAVCDNGRVIAISSKGLWLGLGIGLAAEDQWWQDESVAGGQDVACVEDKFYYVDIMDNVYVRDAYDFARKTHWWKIEGTAATNIS